MKNEEDLPYDPCIDCDGLECSDQDKTGCEWEESKE